MDKQINRWKGFVLGAIGGAAGTWAMSRYWQAIVAIEGKYPRAVEPNKQGLPLDDISLVGKQHKEGESSTDAVGRLLYKKLTGKEPRSKETLTTLSYIVHWVFGMTMGGLYGALRGPARVPDIPGGLALAVGVWGLGDELGIALLGLAEGPTAYPLQMHMHTLGAHVAYGLTTATVTQVLDKVS